ncbi:MAG: MopE-related protein, partial [Bacteroidota bacterium]|nr:MopE-related protein [Bacteroidota bacterium]
MWNSKNKPKTLSKISVLVIMLLVIIISSKEANAQVYNPCSSITTISCGSPVSATMNAVNGAWDFYPSANFINFEGEELIYSFTPSVTGKYTLTVNSTNYNTAGYFYKPASSGCNRYSWTYVTSAYSGGFASVIGTLSAGVPYYIMLDAGSTYSETIHEFQIDCATFYDPCPSIATISCGSQLSLVIPSGPGAIDIPGCSYSDAPAIGKEIIYQYTAASTGKIAISGIISNGNGTMYYIKNASSGCNASGWTCLAEISYLYGPFLSAAYSVTAGSVYYIMADASSLSGSQQTFEITCPEIWNPCTAITAITCSTTVTAVIPSGFGAFDTVGQNCELYYNSLQNPGKEIIYSFTATVSGVHEIEITSTDYNQANYTIKAASGGCNANGWSCVGLAGYPTSLFTSIPLTAGTEYYIMLDANTTSGANHEFNIHCNPPYDPCTGISSISCGISTPVSIPHGQGAFNLPSDYGVTNGIEMIFEFTAAITGTHILQIISHSGIPVNYFIKEASGGCNATGWQNIGVITYGNVTSAISKTLVAGTSYYIMVDGIDNIYSSLASHDLTLICPASSYNPCATITTIPTCGTSVTTIHAQGIGNMAPYPNLGFPYYTPAAGTENIFSFTPTVTGKYSLTALSGTGNINYAIKAATGGCTENGWTNIGLIETYYYNTPVIIPMELQAGTVYYFLADATDTTGISQTFVIDCSTNSNPCANILPVTACGEYSYYNFPAGNGSYSFSCNTSSFNFFPQGSELIFSFTAQETGIYLLDGSQGPGINAYIKNAALGCNTGTWDCLGQEEYTYFQFLTPYNLIAGNTYYIMFQSLNDYNGYGYLNFRMHCQANCTIYADADGDGYGDPALPFSFCYALPTGYSANNNDCNDASAAINPGASEVCGNSVDDNCNGQINEGCGCGLTVNAGIDESTFFGYTADQTVTHTAVVTGGAAPYSYSWTINRPLKCNQVNSAGDEIFMLGTCANTVCPSSGSLTFNPVCTGSASVKVKLMDSTNVCVTVTDVNGCMVTDCFLVMALDARCFNGNSNNAKVKVCHHTNSTNNPWVQICVDQNAVPNLLAQGDYIGNCIALREAQQTITDGLNLSLYPNPAHQSVHVAYESEGEKNYEINLIDVLGKTIQVIKGTSAVGENDIEINLQQLSKGIYQLV